MEILSEIFKGDLRHSFYAKSVEMYEDLKVHANGEFPKKLISERRPKEQKDTLEYREKIFAPITMEPWGKVESSLNKIRKSPDWSIRYASDKVPASIREDETPEIYFEKKFPVYESVTNWAFSEVLPNYMMDANAWIVTIPLEIPKDSAEYLRPYPYIFNSDKVLWTPTKENNFLVLKAEVVGAKDGDEAFWLITDTSIVRYFKEYSKDAVIEFQYDHNKGYIPAFKMRGKYLRSEGASILHVSRFYVMLPRLNEAAREYSDLQAEIVLHIHSKEWEVAAPNCPTCQGVGKVPTTSGTRTCGTCHGKGDANTPYSKHKINPESLTLRGLTTLPIPPMGYIEKNTDIARLQDERVDGHIYKALSAVNFQFLQDVPLNESGKAKEVDRDELNNTVHSVAEDLVAILEKFYWYAIDMRYGVVVSDPEKRKALVPLIPVPERYDLLSASHLMAEIKEAKEAGIAPASLAELQIEYASKKFYNNPEVRERVQSTYLLDPLLGHDQDSKLAMEMSGTALKEDVVISNYLNTFVLMAVEEDKNFFQKTYKEKLEVLKKLAQEKMVDEQQENVEVQDVVEA